jgi:hypothetical protein
METIQRSAVVGVFRDRAKAGEAITALNAAGFRNEQIGFAVRQGDQVKGIGPLFGPKAPGEKEGATFGALHGLALGGVLGAAAAVLIPGVGPAVAWGILIAALSGAAVGGATGGFMGALLRLKVPPEAARYYELHFNAGRSIVTVNAGDREQEAVNILRRYGAYDAETRSGDTATLKEETAASA